MAATLSETSVDGAPGNQITLQGSGLTAGPNASVVLKSQGLVTPADLPIQATFNGTSVEFTLPDGVMSNTLVVTASDLTTASCFLNVVSQYLQAAQYSAVGEGEDTSTLASGELDEILRDASSYIDEYVGTTLRILQVEEDHVFTDTRRIWPYRSPRQRIPLVSLDALSFVTSNAIQTTFNVSGAAPDVYTNKNIGYFDVQTYAVGNAILLGAIQSIGFSANVWRVTYTAGYPSDQYPRAIRKACAIIATELLNKRDLQQLGMGPFAQVDDQFKRRKEPFAIPQPALDYLRPYVARTLA